MGVVLFLYILGIGLLYGYAFVINHCPRMLNIIVEWILPIAFIISLCIFSVRCFQIAKEDVEEEQRKERLEIERISDERK